MRTKSMNSIILLWLLCGVQGLEIITATDLNRTDDQFPFDFLFGVSTAAFQIEGGWNEDGRGPSIWDTLTHEHPERIDDHSNADVAADSYHLYEKDIELLKEMKVNFYRFSISWSRILPDGDKSSLNKAGILYYNNLINRLLENGIEPMVTMNHYDLPQKLQEQGGFLNSRIIDYFEQYAMILFDHYADRVKWWITFNEPVDVCVEGYSRGSFAPSISLPGIGEYFCMDTIIKSHATAYRLYQRKYADMYKGKIGITLSSRFFFSRNNDTDVIDRGMQYWLGWASHPIYSAAGGYPPVMIEDIASNSLREGRAWSRLPKMESKWQTFIQGTADFLGLNYYTARYAEIATTPQEHAPSWIFDANLSYSVDSKWARGKSSWLYSVPEGLRGILSWIKNEYNNPEVIVTENGWSDDGQINDLQRIIYLRQHLQQLQKAIKEDDCNVKGYTVWSIIDNFEWLNGYTQKFGLYSVNWNSTLKERSPKASASFYKTVCETKRIPSEV